MFAWYIKYFFRRYPLVEQFLNKLVEQYGLSGAVHANNFNDACAVSGFQRPPYFEIDAAPECLGIILFDIAELPPDVKAKKDAHCVFYRL